jgi:hypothetical protein
MMCSIRYHYGSELQPLTRPLLALIASSVNFGFDAIRTIGEVLNCPVTAYHGRVTLYSHRREARSAYLGTSLTT